MRICTNLFEYVGKFLISIYRTRFLQLCKRSVTKYSRQWWSVFVWGMKGSKLEWRNWTSEWSSSRLPPYRPAYSIRKSSRNWLPTGLLKGMLTQAPEEYQNMNNNDGFEVYFYVVCIQSFYYGCSSDSNEE